MADEDEFVYYDDPAAVEQSCPLCGHVQRNDAGEYCQKCGLYLLEPLLLEFRGGDL